VYTSLHRPVSPTSQTSGSNTRGSIDGEFFAVLGADGGGGEGDGVNGVGEDFKTVADGIRVVGLAPSFKVAPWLPGVISIETDYELGSRVGVAERVTHYKLGEGTSGMAMEAAAMKWKTK